MNEQEATQVEAPRRGLLKKILLFGCLPIAVLVVLLVGAFFVAVAVDVANQGGDTAGGGGSWKEPSPAEAPALTCQMDEPCDVGDATITITKALEDDVLSVPRNHHYEGHWVIVHFDYTNEGDKPGEASHLDTWKLEDSSGRTYNYDWERTGDHAIRWNQDLGSINGAQPGIKTEGVIIFEAAPGAEGFTLRGGDVVSPRDSKRFEVDLGI